MSLVRDKTTTTTQGMSTRGGADINNINKRRRVVVSAFSHNGVPQRRAPLPIVRPVSSRGRVVAVPPHPAAPRRIVGPPLRCATATTVARTRTRPATATRAPRKLTFTPSACGCDYGTKGGRPEVQRTKPSNLQQTTPTCDAAQKPNVIASAPATSDYGNSSTTICTTTTSSSSTTLTPEQKRNILTKFNGQSLINSDVVKLNASSTGSAIGGDGSLLTGPVRRTVPQTPLGPPVRVISRCEAPITPAQQYRKTYLAITCRTPNSSLVTPSKQQTASVIPSQTPSNILPPSAQKFVKLLSSAADKNKHRHHPESPSHPINSTLPPPQLAIATTTKSPQNTAAEEDSPLQPHKNLTTSLQQSHTDANKTS
ncbi:hypothetical protein Pelo_9829 [Pelomyxa schiedti]|nr:hypothetical protein Pelo_9829 [Pelomyxa schiedti]